MHLILFILAFLTLNSCSKNNTSNLPKDLSSWTVIDVRTPEEFQLGHLSQAINIPHDQIHTIETLHLPKDKPILLYCRSGRRSAIAYQELQNLGYKQVLDAQAYQDLKSIYP